jgi:hypothetical protein
MSLFVALITYFGEEVEEVDEGDWECIAVVC